MAHLRGIGKIDRFVGAVHCEHDAQPSAISAAATVMMNTANTCPVRTTLRSSCNPAGARYLAIATKATLTALNINSMDIRTASTFRRANAP